MEIDRNVQIVAEQSAKSTSVTAEDGSGSMWRSRVNGLQAIPARRAEPLPAARANGPRGRKHLAVHGNVILYHTVVFVVQHVENFEYEFWELKHLKFAGKVLIVNMSSSEEISVYKKCYYCGVYAGFLDAIEFKHSNQPNASICLQLLVEQTNAKISSRLLGRYYSPFILLTLLFITCIVLGTSYKSMLSSILTRPPHSEPYNGDQLVANGYKIVVNKRSKLKLFTEMFSETDGFLLEHVNRLGIPVSGICNQIEYIAQHNAAIMDEKSILQYKTLHKCIDMFDAGGYNSDKLRITIEPIRSAPHAWALTPATPFWKAIDIMIGYLQNGGFLIKWTQDSLLEIGTRRKIAYSKNNMIEQKESDIVRYGCSFLLYIVGNFIASIIFIIEVFISKYKPLNLEI
ncbi:uncharacterized protein [Atheta coriaria]|uniref:uncharacterized protein n=1 Tax=Dalotia coriaria TaxID=877792 RepID=UPI0031F378D9